MTNTYSYKRPFPHVFTSFHTLTDRSGSQVFGRKTVEVKKVACVIHLCEIPEKRYGMSWLYLNDFRFEIHKFCMLIC